MPEIRFYAVKRDLNLLFEIMFTELELIAFELVSEPGCLLTESIREGFDRFKKPHIKLLKRNK